jgi:hypothetical protein
VHRVHSQQGRLQILICLATLFQVGHGETVTVRVPTHDEGTALFWEFSTDSYDIAFGLFFEWNKAAEETEVSVHISDSEDEDLDDEYTGKNSTY